MITTIKVLVKGKVKEITFVVPSKGNANAIAKDYVANKFARIDPNAKIVG